MKCGGVTGWQHVAAMASVYGVPVSNHLWPEISAQLLSATPTAGVPGSWLEYADWWNPVLRDPLAVTDGRAVFDGVIGSGIEFNDSAVQRLLV
jgi:mandelate racemase